MTIPNSPADALKDLDPGKTSAEQGLYRKFDVRRVDGSSQPGGKHCDCEYFVLDMTHDRHARAALQAYAATCAATHPDLSADLIARYRLATVDEAVPITAQSALAAIETFEIVGENNDSREPNANDRFILTEYIAHLFGGYRAEQHGEVNGITVDRRDFFDFVRGAIRSALIDASEQPLESSADAWSDAHNRTEEVFDRLRIAKPGQDAEPIANAAGCALVPCPVCGGEAAGHIDMLERVTISPERRVVAADDPISALLALHAEILDQNDYAYFELARTRRTDWMAWICSNHRDDDPNRKVIAKGQGGTPRAACADALKSVRAGDAS
ncbi:MULTISPECIES: hypothetical protein [Burkholderia cepacia complex]|uniref:hypothetical protein n=1 Tax=Burkholderia cepacia complex TaxID=87882 RepID=UPI000A71631D|nr:MULTISPECIES: hypothetical protein [Burkholderia cepacia complex]MDN7763029.1 hypothetical protein [Burkholderia cepacia]